MTKNYSDLYNDSKKNSWTASQVLMGRVFSSDLDYLPSKYCNTDSMSELNFLDKRKLNQLFSASYLHIFSFVEEYIVNLVLKHINLSNCERDKFNYLKIFVKDELKHQVLLQECVSRICNNLSISHKGISDQESVSEKLLENSELSLFLLTSMIEWYTQSHYVENVKCKDEIDGFYKDVLKYHWIDESRHACADHLIIQEIFNGSEVEPDQIIVELCNILDSFKMLLSKQAQYDIDMLSQISDADISINDCKRLASLHIENYYYTFIFSGLEHPKFISEIENIIPNGISIIKNHLRSEIIIGQ
ncbi:MAG: hypothetical protein JXR18_08745 [Neptuniibacter sp.]